MAGPAVLDLESLEPYAHEYGDSEESASGILSGLGIGTQVIAVIPAYNEEVTIGSVVLGALSQAGHAIVVDDYSQDHTGKIAGLAGATVLSMHRHRGRTTALLTGLLEAEQSDCSTVVVLEDEGKLLTDSIEEVASPIVNGEADVVIGVSPHKQAGGSVRGVGSPMEMSGARPGLWAVSSSALISLDLSPESYGQGSEIIAHLIRKGLTVVEVPILVPMEQDDDAVDLSSKDHEGFAGATAPRTGLRSPLRYMGLPGALVMLGGAALLMLTTLNVVPLGTYLVQAYAGASLLLIGLFLVLSGLTIALRTLLVNASQE